MNSTDSLSATGWEAVFWDIGGVIVDVHSVQDAHRQFVGTLITDHDLDGSVDNTLDVWQSSLREHFREREGTTFRAAREGYAKGVEAVVGKPLPAEAWRQTFERVLESEIRPVPGAVATIETLSGRDIHLGVLSDVDTDEDRRILDWFGVKDRFDSITTSEAVGRTKPDPAMFESALVAADVDPSRALMIGDRYEHDIAGAAELGLQTAGVGLDADAGPALDYPVESPREVLEVLDIDPTV